MSNVVDFLGVTVGRVRNGYCNHKRLMVDESNKTVECVDCKAFIDPFSALMIIMRTVEAKYRSMNKRQEELNIAISEQLGTIAARDVEKAWRSKTMAPACPHCGRGILSSDGFGKSMISKTHESQCRMFESKTK